MYEVIVPWGNITDEFDEWFDANKHRVRYTFGTKDFKGNRARFWFDDPNEAMMFKLTWGGAQ